MIGDIINIDLAAGFAVAFLASTMTAYVGFGGALVMVPPFALLFGPVQAIALMGLCGVIGQARVVAALARDVRWREAGPLCIALIIAIAFGTQFLVSANPKSIRVGIGIFVLLSAAILISNVQYRGPRGAVPSAIVGLLTGTIMGGFGVPAGPMLVVYFLAAPDPPRIQRANILVTAYAMVALALIGLAARGAVEAETLVRAVFIAPASILGAILGRYLFKVAPAAWFKPIAHWILVAIGVSILFA